MYIDINKESIRKLDSFTGVYTFLRNKDYLYIGKSINVKARLLSHLENAKLDKKEALILKNANKIECVITDSDFKALILESQLIQKHHPKYNIRWKDNKSYLYIKINVKENYPKILVVRKENTKKTVYFGPFPSARSVNYILREIRKIFPFCTQKKTSQRPCFYSKIGLCSPCPNQIAQENNQLKKTLMRKVYLNQIRQVIKILQGKTDAVEKKLYAELNELTGREDYESAIILRNKIYIFKNLITQRLFDPNEVLYYNQSKRSIKELLQLLQYYLPRIKSLARIECYDVSNISQKDATASMVVATYGSINKHEYRKFRIKNLKIKSDMQMLEEAIRRRFKNKWKKPSLIVLDGGGPQIRATKKALDEIKINIPIIGIAKNPDRLIIGIDNYPTIQPKGNNLGFNLIKLIRDESHRFAHKYHLFLREKRLYN